MREFVIEFEGDEDEPDLLLALTLPTLDGYLSPPGQKALLQAALRRLDAPGDLGATIRVRVVRTATSTSEARPIRPPAPTRWRPRPLGVGGDHDDDVDGAAAPLQGIDDGDRP